MKRAWYASPYALWMVIFTLSPLLFVAYYAFTDGAGGFTLANFRQLTNSDFLLTLTL